MLPTFELLAGGALGLSFRVYVLPVAIIIAAAGIAAGAISSGQSAGHTAWAVVQAAILIQMGYFGGLLVRHLASRFLPGDRRRPFVLAKKMK